MAKAFEPEFNTPEDLHSKEEVNKRLSSGMSGNLYEEYRDLDQDDISWETEQISKSYGIYLEYNRAVKSRDKDWMYMIRLGIPGGGPITAKQWAVIDDLADRYGRDPDGRASIRLTTRENVQYHWVKKDNVVPLIREAAEAGLLSLNGCGDNVRNIMSCPLAPYSDVFNPRTFAYQAAKYFQLPVGPFVNIFQVDPNAVPEERESFKYGPQLLNRKFKMAFSTVHRDPETGILVPDNCVELRTHDLGVAPVIVENEIDGFQIYVGGGQGERNGKPSSAMLAVPFARVSEAQLWSVMDAIVQVHQKWGDRKNRHWARLKYVIRKMGVAWFRERVEELLGYSLQDPDLNHDVGSRHLHHGWHQQADGNFAFGAFVECGRLMDDMPAGDVKSMVRHLVDKFDVNVMLTPNQDIMFTDIPEAVQAEFDKDLRGFGYGQRAGKPVSRLRRASGACVGKVTCRLAYTESEGFEPELMEQLEDLGWGSVATSIGITGCERQCFRPATKAFGLIGTGSDRYQLKLFGTEDARHQGLPLVSGEEAFLRSIPRERVAGVIDTLLHFWRANAEEGESPGYFMRRMGQDGLLKYLRVHPKTADLLEKSQKHTAILV